MDGLRSLSVFRNWDAVFPRVPSLIRKTNAQRQCRDLWKHPQQMVQQMIFPRGVPLCPTSFLLSHRHTSADLGNTLVTMSEKLLELHFWSLYVVTFEFYYWCKKTCGNKEKVAHMILYPILFPFPIKARSGEERKMKKLEHYVNNQLSALKD